MICCDRDKFSNSKFTGIPKLVVEILSYTTRHRDTGIKLNVYESFGVDEYWIVDIAEGKINIYSDNVIR